MLDISIRVPQWFAGKRKSYWTGNLKWFTFHRYGKIGEHRGWEFQLDYWGWTKLFGLIIGLDTTGSDHAGPEFELTILGFMVRLEFPDSRHWNHKEGRFYRDDEPEPGFDYDPDEDDDAE